MIVFQLNMAMFIAAMLSLPWLPFSLWDLARNWQNWSKSTFYIKNESNKWKAEKGKESVFSLGLWHSVGPRRPGERKSGERSFVKDLRWNSDWRNLQDISISRHACFDVLGVGAKHFITAPVLNLQNWASAEACSCILAVGFVGCTM